jgi:hypothetical protein
MAPSRVREHFFPRRRKKAGNVPYSTQFHYSHAGFCTPHHRYKNPSSPKRQNLIPPPLVTNHHRRGHGGRRRRQQGAGARASPRLCCGAAADADSAAEAEVGGGVRALLRHAAAGTLRAAAPRAPPHYPGHPAPPRHLAPRVIPRRALHLLPHPPLRGPRPHRLHRRRCLRPYRMPLPSPLPCLYSRRVFFPCDRQIV